MLIKGVGPKMGFGCAGMYDHMLFYDKLCCNLTADRHVTHLPQNCKQSRNGTCLAYCARRCLSAAFVGLAKLLSGSNCASLAARIDILPVMLR